MFGVARQIKSIDDGYFLFLNYRTGKFEVHNRHCSPSTLCLVLPYETLDARTVDRVRYTRAERIKQLLAEAERNNSALEARLSSSAASSIAAAGGAL